MFKDNLFDEISRTLASPMKRRGVFKLIAGTLAGSLFGAFLPKRALAAGLATTVGNFSVTNARVVDVIDLLRSRYRVPVSFIEANEDLRVSITVSSGTVLDVLSQIPPQNPVYQWVELDGRLIVFPNYLDLDLNRTVDQVNIVNAPRLQAVEQYIDILKAQLPEFQWIAGTVLLGNPKALTFSTPVSLSPRASVLRQFTELLGDDALVTFTIIRAKTGVHLFTFERLESSGLATSASAAAATACRAISATYTAPTNPACTGGRCGGGIVYDITGVVTCPGDNCGGMTLTEVVTNDHGCLTVNVQGGAGCPIASGNTISNCTDTYQLCAPPASLPNTCTETVTQLVSVGGRLVQTCFIAFKVRVANGTCSATVVRTCTSANRSQQCCNDNAGNAILCNVGEVCIGGACCPPTRVCGTGSAAVCCGVGQRCLSGRCFGSNCNGASICRAAPACGSGGCVCFRTVEALGFCHRSQPCAGLQTCTSSGQCPVGWACVNVTCCGAQSVCIRPCSGTNSIANSIAPLLSGPTTTGQ